MFEEGKLGLVSGKVNGILSAAQMGFFSSGWEKLALMCSAFRGHEEC